MNRINLFQLQEMVQEVNDLNGWTPTQEDIDNKWYIPSILALIHSEVSEALEGYRNGDMDNVKEEIADVIIRCLDLCTRLDFWTIETYIVDKIDKNRERGDKHGGKLI